MHPLLATLLTIMFAAFAISAAVALGSDLVHWLFLWLFR